MEPLVDFILSLDRDTFVAINTGMTNSILDQVMPVWTELHKQPIFWGIVATFILVQIFRTPRDPNAIKTKARGWLIGALIVGASMGLADLVAYRGVKIWVERPRPEAAGVPVELRTHSHSGWSFPSNHAANNFALARTVQLLAPTWTIPAYAFAASVAFSRVYVGVHYPLDVVFGGVIGFLCASFIAFVARKIQSKF